MALYNFSVSSSERLVRGQKGYIPASKRISSAYALPIPARKVSFVRMFLI